MNIALISFYNRYGEYPTKYSLATLRLASILCARKGVNVRIIPFDLESMGTQLKELSEQLSDFNVDILGMSAYIWTWDACLKIRQQGALLHPKMKYVIGGPEVSNRDDRNWFGDEIFVNGEGEAFWDEFVTLLLDGAEFEKLQASMAIGSSVKNGFYFYSPSLSPLMHGDAINSPTFCEKVKGYEPSKKFAWVETSRGCMYNCGYCGHKSRKGVATFDVDFVKQEVICLGENQIERAFIVDPIVGGTPQNGKQVFELFKEYAPNTSIVAYLRPEYLDDEYIKLLSESNIEEVRIGVQTLTHSVPKWIRNNQISHILEKLPALATYGIPWRCELIVGLPGDTMDGLVDTLRTVINEIKPTYVYGYHLSVLKETPMGKLLNADADEWVKVWENGVSAASSHSYTEQQMQDMLTFSKTVTEEYNKNVKFIDGKAYNTTNGFESLQNWKKLKWN